MLNWNQPSVNRHPVHAVLLAAGRGKRLAPHTDYVPKPILALNGRPLRIHTPPPKAGRRCTFLSWWAIAAV